MLSIIVLLLVLQNCDAVAFHTTSYSYETGIGTPQYMSQDLSKIVSYGTASKSAYSIQIYAVNEKNMTLVSQTYLKTCATMRCSGNVEKLLCIDSTMSILRLYNMNGYEISFIQEITLGFPLASFLSVSFSFDGSYLLIS